MDEYELLAKLRQKHDLQGTLFVAVSGFKRRSEDGKDGRSFDCYLEKPVNPTELLALLEKGTHAKKAITRRSAGAQNARPHTASRGAVTRDG